MASEAARTIRASIAALPSYAKRHRWERDDAGNVFSGPPRTAGTHWLAEADNNAIAEWTRLMCPAVGEAIADLLDAIASDDRFPLYRWQERVDEARDALEAAILRSRA